jgi:hypothetical protein
MKLSRNGEERGSAMNVIRQEDGKESQPFPLGQGPDSPKTTTVLERIIFTFFVLLLALFQYLRNAQLFH